MQSYIKTCCLGFCLQIWHLKMSKMSSQCSIEKLQRWKTTHTIFSSWIVIYLLVQTFNQLSCPVNSLPVISHFYFFFNFQSPFLFWYRDFIILNVGYFNNLQTLLFSLKFLRSVATNSIFLKQSFDYVIFLTQKSRRFLCAYSVLLQLKEHAL